VPALRRAALTKRDGDVTALDGCSLSVEDGAIFGLLGPNGSGKPTTIEIPTGGRRPTDGSAAVLGADPTTDPIAVRAAVGILPEREEPANFLTPREYPVSGAYVGSLRGRALDLPPARAPRRAGLPRTRSDLVYTRRPRRRRPRVPPWRATPSASRPPPPNELPFDSPLFASFGVDLAVVAVPILVGPSRRGDTPLVAPVAPVGIALGAGLAGLVLARRSGPRGGRKLRDLE
jgi:hypothetical protein